MSAVQITSTFTVMKNTRNSNGVSVTRIQNNATTVSPNFVTQFVTANPDLERKTALVVIEEQANILSVYRQSGKVPGTYSRDIYMRKGGRWKYKKKDAKKYHDPPHPPSEAFHREYNGLRISTLSELSDEELRELMRLIRS